MQWIDEESCVIQPLDQGFYNLALILHKCKKVHYPSKEKNFNTNLSSSTLL